MSNRCRSQGLCYLEWRVLLMTERHYVPGYMQIQWSLLWRHNGHDGVSNHQHHECLLNRPPRRRSKKTPKLRVTGLCAGNSPETGEFSAQMASNAENVSIWWRHHGLASSPADSKPQGICMRFALCCICLGWALSDVTHVLHRQPW